MPDLEAHLDRIEADAHAESERAMRHHDPAGAPSLDVERAEAHAALLQTSAGVKSVDAAILRRLIDGTPPIPPETQADIASTARRYAEIHHGQPAALRLEAVRVIAARLVERLRAFHVAEDEGEAAADVEQELDLVDRLRRTIDEVEVELGLLADAVAEEAAP